MSWSAPLLTVTEAESPRKAAANSRRSSLNEIWGIENRRTEDVGPCRTLIRRLVESKWFQQAILGAILFNTLSMGVEYHDQVGELIMEHQRCACLSGHF